MSKIEQSITTTVGQCSVKREANKITMTIGEKKTSEMTNREILRQLLELLSDRTQAATSEDLVKLANAMVQVYSVLGSCE